MPAPDDISDMFDDELTRSIAKAKDGPWRDSQPEFVDPTLQALEQQLAGRQRRDYRQRRLDELKQRGAGQEAPSSKPAPPQKPASPKARPAKPDLEATLWGNGEFVEPNEAAFAESTPAATSPAMAMADAAVAAAPTAGPSTPATAAAAGASAAAPPPPVLQAARQRTHLDAIAPFCGAIGSAMFVVAVATAGHALLTGWSIQLLLRAASVALISGLLWQIFRTGRLRSTAILTCAYTAGFLPSDQLGRIEHTISLFLGVFAVVAGAALLGDRRQRF